MSILFSQYTKPSAKKDIQALAKFTAIAFNNSKQSVLLLNQELIQIQKVDLQNCMALDILTAVQDGICAPVKQKCCTFIPDNDTDVSDFLDHKNTTTEKLSDISYRDAYIQWLSLLLGHLGTAVIFLLCVVIILVGCFVFNCYLGAAKSSNPILIKTKDPLPGNQEHF